MDYNLIIESVVVVLLAVMVVLELKRDLMMLQQNSYRAERYRRWLTASKDTTGPSRLAAMAVFLGSLVKFVPHMASMWLYAVLAIAISGSLATRRYKKPLVFTMRAVRIFAVALFLALAIVLTVSLSIGRHSTEFALWLAMVSLLGVYCLSHIVILAANLLLEPVQRMINRRYYNDAARILGSMPDLKVIGITGSYGKTSTKHYLYRILAEEFETVMTPGSFNTTLGVVRTVREYLQPYTQIFIAEMGAKQIGDIKEICDLVHPSIGIVTAVGEQHLESFKSIENVQRTKFELIDALPADGFAVVNNDFEYVANRKVDNVAVVRYGLKDQMGKEATVTASDIRVDAHGTDFTMTTAAGESHRYHTRLVGDCNISNLLAAIVVALHLGMKPASIARAVEQIEQVEHRLNVKRMAGGITLIDDAFNSNPVGSGMALDVMRSIEAERRIIITPGMIELGDRQASANREFGRKIAQTADIALIVGHYNSEAILAGIADEANEHLTVKEFATFAEAQSYFQQISRKGDVVLYENDLPDTFK